ncbi:class I SAM-dependent methyltransferase [Pedobacter flavus]|uniref:Class I SAM-dependent methyltransferase n=1 Tax=Pedobacter flavus TaxID=3113906 RepID=A0ABU7GYQ1_9SPHI|nr:class I SAM-dependent methyltransferase [Pedobacter sp. VNH31]MEE1883913.1 class I SAM-dependent methyltransferase [Pedobacter sp. VNH31]
MLSQLKHFLNTKRIKNRIRSIENCSTLLDVAIFKIKNEKLNGLNFLEIGVFKGDNAVYIYENIHQLFNIRLKYFGFDIFDDIHLLKEKYPKDLDQYNLADYPYWEFNSGQHTFNMVHKKLASTIAPENFKLIKGDTTETLKNIEQELKETIDLVFIDGCHEYEVVKSDWENISNLFKINPKLTVVFDDFTYEGVKNTHDKILETGFYLINRLNNNQFIVTLK